MQSSGCRDTLILLHLSRIHLSGSGFFGFISGFGIGGGEFTVVDIQWLVNLAHIEVVDDNSENGTSHSFELHQHMA